VAGAERMQSARAEIFLRLGGGLQRERVHREHRIRVQGERSGSRAVEAWARRGRNQAPLTLNTSEATSPQIAKTTDRRVLRVRY
jgi:hypothetical protein